MINIDAKLENDTAKTCPGKKNNLIIRKVSYDISLEMKQEVCKNEGKYSFNPGFTNLRGYP